MVASAVLLLSTFLTPLISVSATPVSAPLEPRDGTSSLFFGTAPESAPMLDPPQRQHPLRPVSFRKLSGANQGSNKIPGVTIQEILNLPAILGPAQTAQSINLTIPAGDNGAEITWALQESECANERLEYYITTERKEGRSSWQAMVEDLGKKDNRPKVTLQKAVEATASQINDITNSLLKPAEPNSKPVDTLLGYKIEPANATFDIFGYSSAVNFTYSLHTTPETPAPDPVPSNETVSVAAFLYLNQALTSLSDYVNNDETQFTVESASVAWVGLNTLRDLTNNAVKTLIKRDVSPTNQTPIPSADDVKKGLAVLMSGRYGNPGGEFVKYESLQDFIRTRKGEPDCFRLFGKTG